jgi:hypothetical protein
MRPKIFDLLFNDDRKFVMEICKVKVNSVDKWAVITRRNVPDFPPFRTDQFDTREEALAYYYKIVVQTPLISLGENSPNPPITIEQYKTWLKSKNLKDEYLNIT